MTSLYVVHSQCVCASSNTETARLTGDALQAEKSAEVRVIVELTRLGKRIHKMRVATGYEDQLAADLRAHGCTLA